MQNLSVYSAKKIAKIVNGRLLGYANQEVSYLLTDSRRLIFPDASVFFALKTESNDGQNYIGGLYAKGIKCFVVSQSFDATPYPEASFIFVENVLQALQNLAAWHRQQFAGQVIGITGSNGKTIVKEWLFELLQPKYNTVRSPRSYNSQIGVALSLWQIHTSHQVAIIEAGISARDEMQALQKMIQPTMGIFTNIGHAHSQGFASLAEKAAEKAQLFAQCNTIIYCADSPTVHYALLNLVGKQKQRLHAWSFANNKEAIWVEKKQHTLVFHYGATADEVAIPYKESGAVENFVHAYITAKILGVPAAVLADSAQRLPAVAMRLEERKAVRNNLLINDFYNSDPESVRLAFEHLMQLPTEMPKIVVISAFEGLQIESQKAEYEGLVILLNSQKIAKIIGVGEALRQPFSQLKHPHILVERTEDLLKMLGKLNWQNSAILLKGSRKYGFERIADALKEQIHQTWLEINLSALAQNLRYYRSQIQPQVKLMAMVKAQSYGAGSLEIGRVLQYNRVDYLAVAYTDEGVELRQNGITLPIMVMNADPDSYARMIEYRLEPELYSLKTITLFLRILRQEYTAETPYPIHLKIETGMHRLGLEQNQIAEALQLLAKAHVMVASIFSHLAASDAREHDDFSRNQISIFGRTTAQMIATLGYKPMLHIANTAAISHFPEAQLDMVRLGIGMYGISNNPKIAKHLKPVTRWLTRISQIKNLEIGDSVSYGRTFVATQKTTIATLPVGYADGFLRILGNGVGRVFVANSFAPVVGKVCMDMVMIDVTNLPVAEGDMVEILGENATATQMAAASNTIAYEVLTHISGRVQRIYITE